MTAINHILSDEHPQRCEVDMKIRFYGVRGSIPAPITTDQIRSKISAVVQRITPGDITSQDARERFLCGLPNSLFGTVGGDTACVLLTSSDGESIILDAGSGIRQLGKDLTAKGDTHFNLFLSHFHYDHIQGIMFFEPVFKKTSNIDVYSCFPQAQQYLADQQPSQYFPIPFAATTGSVNFHTISPGEPLRIGDLFINSCKMQHPGTSYSFSFVEGNKKFVYATDVELSQDDFSPGGDRERVFRNADVVILDAQYTMEEFYKKHNWGHSSFCYAVDFAVYWGIKNLYLFHHEPSYDDKKLQSIEDAAMWYAKYIVKSNVNIKLAVQGSEINI